MATDSDSQGPIFLERLRSVFRSSADERRRDEEPHRGTAVATCVLLSVVLWLSLTLYKETRTVTLNLPVEVAEVPSGQALAELPPSSVQVRVEGSGVELLRLMFSPPPIKVAANQGRVNVRETLDLPQGAGVRIENVSPQEFVIQTEPRIEKRVPVQPHVRVTLASAHELIEEPSVTPDSIKVFGAESVVDSISAWPTDSLVIENLQDTTRKSVPLADTLSRLVERSTDEVTVVAKAGKFAEATREVTVEVTGVPSDQDLVALQPSSIRIRYRVLFSQLFESKRASGFFATVSYSQIRSDTTGYVEPTIHVPSDLLIRNPEPIPARLRYYTFLSEE